MDLRVTTIALILPVISTGITFICALILNFPPQLLVLVLSCLLRLLNSVLYYVWSKCYCKKRRYSVATEVKDSLDIHM